jgi:hypothetical protein
MPTFNPNVNPIGEEEGYPRFVSTPKGDLTYRCVRVAGQDTWNWINYFINNPADPYSLYFGSTYPPLLLNYRVEGAPRVQLLPANSPMPLPFPGAAGYIQNLIYLDYSNIGIGLHNNVIYQEEIIPREESVPVDTSQLLWNDKSPFGLRSTLPIPGEEYIITFPFANSPVLYLTMGSVNSDTFTTFPNFATGLSLRTWTAGQMLYEGSNIVGSSFMAGNQRWRKTLKFKTRQYDWNKEWHVATGQFENVYLSDGVTQYKRFAATTFTGNVG